MVYKIISLFLILMFSGVYQLEIGVNDPNAYGPYKVDWSRNYEACHGPKSRNLGENSLEIFQNAKGEYLANMTLTFFEHAHMDEVKIIVKSIKENKTNALWSYKVNKPCQHFTIAVVLEQHLKSTNCNIKKGVYKLILNITEQSNLFFGTNFFYGEYLLKAFALSGKGNLFCVVYRPVFTKKT